MLLGVLGFEGWRWGRWAVLSIKTGLRKMGFGKGRRPLAEKRGHNLEKTYVKAST